MIYCCLPLVEKSILVFAIHEKYKHTYSIRTLTNIPHIYYSDICFIIVLIWHFGCVFRMWTWREGIQRWRWSAQRMQYLVRLALPELLMQIPLAIPGFNRKVKSKFKETLIRLNFAWKDRKRSDFLRMHTLRHFIPRELAKESFVPFFWGRWGQSYQLVTSSTWMKLRVK